MYQAFLLSSLLSPWKTCLIIGKLVMCFDKALHLVLWSFLIPVQSLYRFTLVWSDSYYNPIEHIIPHKGAIFVLMRLYSYVLINFCFNNWMAYSQTSTFHCTIKCNLQVLFSLLPRWRHLRNSLGNLQFYF